MLNHLHIDKVHHMTYTEDCNDVVPVDLVEGLRGGVAHGQPQADHWCRVDRVMVLRLNLVEPHTLQVEGQKDVIQSKHSGTCCPSSY